MRKLFDRQLSAWLAEGEAGVAIRRDRLTRLLALMRDHQDQRCAAVSDDVGGARSAATTMLRDLLICETAIKHDPAQLARWMRPQRRSPDFRFGLLRASTRIIPSARGVIGIVAPWNRSAQ